MIDEDDFLAELDSPDNEPVKVEVVPAKASETAVKPRRPLSTEERMAERLHDVESEIFLASMTTVRDGLRFRDIDPSAVSPPRAWIDEIGEEEAWRRFRMAIAAWQPGKNAPAGLSMAKDIMVGIAKARASEKSSDRPLNVAVQVAVPMSVYKYPTREVEE